MCSCVSTYLSIYLCSLRGRKRLFQRRISTITAKSLLFFTYTFVYYLAVMMEEEQIGDRFRSTTTWLPLSRSLWDRAAGQIIQIFWLSLPTQPPPDSLHDILTTSTCGWNNASSYCVSYVSPYWTVYVYKYYIFRRLSRLIQIRARAWIAQNEPAAFPSDTRITTPDKVMRCDGWMNRKEKRDCCYRGFHAPF